VIKPESSNEFPWISIWRLEAHSKHVGYVLRLLNRTGCCVWLYQKNLWLFMFEMHLISGITDGWQGCEPPPCQAKCKNRACPYLACISIFTILLVSVDCCFFAFFGLFSGDYGFLYSHSIAYRICYCFSTIFWVLASGSFQLIFPMAQTSSYGTAPDQSRLYCR